MYQAGKSIIKAVSKKNDNSFRKSGENRQNSDHSIGPGTLGSNESRMIDKHPES
jgi:hypothetical protein